MAGYTRQDTANNIANGNVIDADDLDGEFNQVESAFNVSSGHVHDGTTGNGAPITKVGPSQDLIVSATSVLPKTTNTLDVGSSGAQFKDAYFDGTVDTDTLTVSGNGTVGGTLGVTGATTLSSTAAITGNTTVGGTLAVTGQTTLNGGLVMDTNKFVVADTTGNTTIAGTLGVTGLSTLATVDVNGGAIDGTVIGANTAAAITGTTITGTSLVGPLTGNASTATALATARSITIDGDVDASATNFDGTGNITLTTTLDTVNSNVGSFGSATAIPVLTVNGKGLVTAASTADITTTLTITADTANLGGGSNDTVSLADDTLTFAGTANEIETTVTNNQIQIGLPNNVTVGSNLTVTGNLEVQGTTVTLNTENVDVEDATLRLAKNTTTLSATNGAGIEFGGASSKPTLTWDNSNTRLASNKDLSATRFHGPVTGAVTGNATTATTLATPRAITLAGDVTGTANFNGSSNISITATVADDSHNHTIANVDNLQISLNAKAALAGSSSQAFSASTLNATTVDLGNWTITESGGVLYFATSAVNKMKLDASGNLTVVGNVTAYGTI
jgi:hypothetical protein